MRAVGIAFRLLLLGALAALAGGCAARTSAAPVAAPVDLRPPAPPPRILPAPPDPVAPEPVADTAVVPPPAAPPRPPSRPAARPPAVAPATSPEASPAPALRPGVTSGSSATTEASVRTLLESARRDLARITPASLSADARTQYEAASRFADQADAALKARNLVYAGMLADKAATLAAALLR
jgi:hypothetical protein